MPYCENIFLHLFNNGKGLQIFKILDSNEFGIIIYYQ